MYSLARSKGGDWMVLDPLDHAFDYAQVEYCAIEYCFFNTKKPCNSPQGYLAFFSISSCHKVYQRHTAKWWKIHSLACHFHTVLFHFQNYLITHSVQLKPHHYINRRPKSIWSSSSQRVIFSYPKVTLLMCGGLPFFVHAGRNFSGVCVCALPA